MRNVILLTTICLLAFCTSDQVGKTATIIVRESQFKIEITAKGELRAVQATPINAPATQIPLNITWLALEGKNVKKGEVLVRFDDQDIISKKEKARDEIRRLDFEEEKTSRSHQKESGEMNIQLELTQLERTQAAAFAPKDERLYSREEIIDSQINLDFLDAKIDHFQIKKGRHAKKAETDMQLMDLEQNTFKLEMEQLSASGDALEILAPHDGCFYVNDRGWQGKPRVGMMVWMGQKLGELPDLSSMEAKINVLEVEAAGLEVGLPAVIELDGYPGIFHHGVVKSVGALAKAIERNNPIKYFEVVLTIKTTLPGIMKPGSHVTTRILVSQQDNVIAAPNQVIFHEENQAFVYVLRNGQFVKQPVVLGQRSVTQTIITKGLEPGMKVALSEPQIGQDF